MTHARLWLSIFLSGFAVCACILLHSLLTHAPYGDLSRVGRISEDDFGWKTEPPRIDGTILQGAPIDQADILVIGDSFSASHVWQSALVRDGHSVATTYWSQMDEMLCADFEDWLSRIGFKGKLVIIESVERLLNARLTRAHNCTPMKRPLAAMSDPTSPPLEHVPTFALNWDAQLFSGWMTHRCTRAAIAGKARTGCNPMTLARPVAEGCTLFSHRRCDMALFLADDLNHGQLTAADVAGMQAFSKAHARTQLLWMVVPNKWTAYLEPARSHAFVSALRQTDLGPDLFSFVQQEKTEMRDFYFPNDTHISTRGLLVLGERMAQAVRQKLDSTSVAGRP